MIFVAVKGGTPRQQARVKDMVNYVAEELMPRQKSIELVVLLKSINDGADGYCHPIDEESRVDRPREFVIEVDRRLNMKTMLEVVAHEMVHVKQFARGELYHSATKQKYRWQGRWIDYKLSYSQMPWEKEALKLEERLFDQWVRENGLSQQKWVRAKYKKSIR